MLQLSLIRHAKSSWHDPATKDFDRPLNNRGQLDAPLMGRTLRARSIGFDKILSSPAKRAITTAELIAGQLENPKTEIVILSQLYAATPEVLLDCVQHLDARDTHVAVVAHNPGLTQFCNYLSDAQIDNLPTCAIALIDFEFDDWRAVYEGNGTLRFVEYPRQHAD